MYYNISSDKIGGVMGLVGFYCELLVICTDIVGGPMMDIFGRKYPISIGMLVAGIFMFLIPFFKNIYPGFFICRAMISVGTIFTINVPLLPDYV